MQKVESRRETDKSAQSKRVKDNSDFEVNAAQ